MASTQIYVHDTQQGKLVALATETPLLSSITAWEGFTAEQHFIPAREEPEICLPMAVLNYQIGPPVTVERWVDGRVRSQLMTPGALTVAPAGSLHRYRLPSPAELFTIAFDATLLDCAAHESVRGLSPELIEQHGGFDPWTAHLCDAIRRELAVGCPGGPLRGEVFGHSLVTRLMEISTARSPGSLARKGGLSQASLRRVTEYIEAHLSGTLHLSQLAGISQLSAFHFSRMFRASVGVSPHAYVLARRVERAKERLRYQKVRLDQVASDCGFKSQAYFTSAFRREAGVTPLAYRRATSQ